MPHSNKRHTPITKNLINAAAFNRINTILVLQRSGFQVEGGMSYVRGKRGGVGKRLQQGREGGGVISQVEI